LALTETLLSPYEKHVTYLRGIDCFVPFAISFMRVVLVEMKRFSGEETVEVSALNPVDALNQTLSISIYVGRRG